MDKFKTCPECGSKMKSEFWPYPLAIRLGDKWTTDVNIIKSNFKGRHEIKMSRNKAQNLHTSSEDKTVNPHEEL